jgi:hypothetical protein
MADAKNAPELRMDAADLWREEIITDRKIGTIRVLTPVRSDGSIDPARRTLFMGEAQMMTNVGALPVSFEIEAVSLAQAVEQYGELARDAFERAVRELQDMRRQAASSLVLPGSGAALGPGGLPPGVGSGKIQLP